VTHDEIVEMCNSVLNKKAEEYASPEDRWHNFYQSSVLFQDFAKDFHTVRNISPIDCCLFFSLKHYTSCVDILSGKAVSDELRKEKGGDLVCYYLIYRCLKAGRVTPETSKWLLECTRKPWSLGYDLLRGLK